MLKKNKHSHKSDCPHKKPGITDGKLTIEHIRSMDERFKFTPPPKLSELFFYKSYMDYIKKVEDEQNGNSKN